MRLRPGLVWAKTLFGVVVGTRPQLLLPVSFALRRNELRAVRKADDLFCEGYGPLSCPFWTR
jgi:hypothetical protein